MGTPGRLLLATVFSLLTLSPLAAQQAPDSISTVAGGGGPNTFANNICIPAYFGGIYQGNYYIKSCNQVFKVTPQGLWTLVAGNGQRTTSGDGGPATSASFSELDAVFVDGSGNVFVADGNLIREVSASTGIIQTIAGNGNAGFGGDGGAPTSAMLNTPEGIYEDTLGDIFIADTNNCRIRKVTSGVITTIAGTGTCGYNGDGVAPTSAELRFPYGVWVDSAGNNYIADTNNNRIREIVAQTGLIQTVAGTGIHGSSGDGGAATSAEIAAPQSVYVDAAGDLFIADSQDCRVRKVVSGLISTIAGDGICGYAGDGGPATAAAVTDIVNLIGDASGDIFIADQSGIREILASSNHIQTAIGNNAFGFSGDGGPATSAQLFEAAGVASDSSGNVFFVDTDNYRIREVVAATGLIRTVAGDGIPGFSGDGGPATGASIGPYNGLAVDGSGNIFFIDNGNRIREVVAATGSVKTIAGNGVLGFGGDGGPATSAEINAQNDSGIAVDAQGNIFIGDYQNNRVREVVAATGIINTVAGDGAPAFSGDGGPALYAEVYEPSAIALDSAGDIFIADNGNNRVREILAATGVIETVAGSGLRGHTGDGGLAINAAIAPNSIALDSAGNLFIGGGQGNPWVREVIAATGTIETVAGNGLLGFSGDGGPATSAAINFNGFVAVNPSNGLLISDTNNARIRYVAPSPALSFTSISPTSTLAGTGVTLTVTGTGFLFGAVVTFNGNAETTTFVSSTQLTATVPAGAVATAGTYTVGVTNPLPSAGGATATFTVQALPVSISLLPEFSVAINTGSTFQFNPVVLNAPNTGVTWQVNGIANGNTTFGTISGAGLYTAPSSVPNPATFTITATSTADPTKSASITVTIQAVSSGTAPPPLPPNSISTVAGGGPSTSAPQLCVPGYLAGIYQGNYYFNSCNQIFRVSQQGGQWTLIAGNGLTGFAGDGGPAKNAEFSGINGLFVDGSGNVFVSDTGNERVREIVAATGIIQTIAGNGTAGFSGDGGPATSAMLSGPYGLFVDAAGDVFVADRDNCRIREVSGGIIVTTAGTGICGYNGDGILPTSAELFSPTGGWIDSAGNGYIADSNNGRIREIVAATGLIQTVAGNGLSSLNLGDGGPATSAHLSIPENVFVDASGNIFIADEGQDRIRKVTAATGIIQTVAGNGTSGYTGDGGPATSAELVEPTFVFGDSSGNIYISDFVAIREVSAATGIIQTLIGNSAFGFSGDAGIATSAQLLLPYGVATDNSGNIFFADEGNARVREVVAATGLIKTIAGNGTYGFSGDGGPATSAQLDDPFGIAVDGSGNVFISEFTRIRKVSASTGIIQTVAGNGTTTFSGDGGPATSAGLGGVIYDIAVDSQGDIFIPSGNGGAANNNRIREVFAATGIIQTIAGNGTTGFSGDGGPATSAMLSLSIEGGIAVDRSGNVFFSDRGNLRVREILAATGIIQTVAGNGNSTFSGDGGPAINAGLNPIGVAIDSSGNLFISDALSVRAVSATTGVINTVAGNRNRGFAGDGGPATGAELNGALYLAVNPAGGLLLNDELNARIRYVSPSLTPAITSLSPNVTAVGTGLTLTVTGTNFASGAVINFNGKAEPTTFMSGTQMIATIPSTDVATVGAGSVTVTNSLPGGATSAGAPFVVESGVVAVAISPTSATISLGATLQFTATVSNATNTSVIWSVNGVANGNANVGTISSSGLYTAPSSVSSPATFTVTAISVADGTKSASATVTVQVVGVSIAPASATVSVGLSAQFTATVTGATNTAVTWQVNGIANGNATFGTISASGLYTAPSTIPTPGAFPIKATSVADTTKSASATVTITAPAAAPVSVQISPQPSTVVTGSTVQFGAVVMNAGTSTAVTWQLVSGAGTGSITAAGLYTPPATAPSGSVIVQATSVADPTKTQQISFTVAPAALNFAPGQPTTVPPISAQNGGSSSANLALNLAPTAGSATFTLTCDQMPPGAACTVNPTTVTAQGGHPGAPFTLTVLIASSARLGPLPGARPSPWRLFLLSLCVSFAGSLWAIYLVRRSPVRQARYAWLMILLVSFSVVYLAACSGISSTTVSSPPVSAVRSGSVIDARVTATPTSTSGGFTATQMIVPFPVQ